MHLSEMSHENRGAGGYCEGAGGGHLKGEEGEAQQEGPGGDEGHQDGPGDGIWKQGGGDEQESGRGLEQRSSRGRGRMGDERVAVAARSSLNIILSNYMGPNL